MHKLYIVSKVGYGIGPLQYQNSDPDQISRGPLAIRRIAFHA